MVAPLLYVAFMVPYRIFFGIEPKVSKRGTPLLCAVRVVEADNFYSSQLLHLSSPLSLPLPSPASSPLPPSSSCRLAPSRCGRTSSTAPLC